MVTAAVELLPPYFFLEENSLLGEKDVRNDDKNWVLFDGPGWLDIVGAKESSALERVVVTSFLLFLRFIEYPRYSLKSKSNRSELEAADSDTYCEVSFFQFWESGDHRRHFGRGVKSGFRRLCH